MTAGVSRPHGAAHGQGQSHNQAQSISHSQGHDTPYRISGKAVRHGASYSGGLASALTLHSSVSSLSPSSMAGGPGVSRMIGAGIMGLSAIGVGVPSLGLRGAGAGKALRAITSSFRARLGDQVITISGYGVNPLFMPGAGTGFGKSYDSAASMPLIDPSTLPPIDTVQVTRIKEKQDLQTLNDKFAALVDKVRVLEQQNTIMKAQIGIIMNPDEHNGPVNTVVVMSSIQGTYNVKIEELKAVKIALLSEIDHLTGVIEDYTNKHQEETEKTKMLEDDWNTHKDDIDNIYMTIVEMQTKVHGAEDHINMTKQIYNARVREVQTSITRGSTAAVSITVDNSVQATDLTTAVQEVKAHYEALASKSREEAFAKVKSQIHEVVGTIQPGTQALTQAKEQIRVYKLQINSIHREIDRLHKQNAELEAQVEETESTLKLHKDQWTENIRILKLDLNNIRKQMSQYAKNYQDLLAAKMSLDIEIVAYRKLLDTEESRINTERWISLRSPTGTFTTSFGHSMLYSTHSPGGASTTLTGVGYSNVAGPTVRPVRAGVGVRSRGTEVSWGAGDTAAGAQGGSEADIGRASSVAFSSRKSNQSMSRKRS